MSIAYKDQKAFMRDLKRVYGAESEEIAMRNLEGMMDTWKKYAVVLDSWLDKWEHLSTYFCYVVHRIRLNSRSKETLRQSKIHCPAD